MSDVSCRKEGRAGRVTLTRPQALNALSFEMSLEIFAALGDWAEDPDVDVIVMDAEGERAFCAGGDLARIYNDAKDDKGVETVAFWQNEYELNDRIATFPKPVVVFMQGFVMGGGVGIAGHASHRIAGETTQIAMPECAIGLIPDVGGSFILSRAPGALGEYLGVTGARMGAADAILAGFADTYVPEGNWSDLKAQIIETGSTDAIGAARSAPPDGTLAAAQDQIDRVFSAPDLVTINERLAGEEGPVAEYARKAISKNSPLSMHTALELVHRIRRFDTVRQAVALEFRAAARCLLEGDFVEGIRAQIIDKDRTPHWKHGTLDAVSHEDVAHMLRPFDDPTLEFEEIPE